MQLFIRDESFLHVKWETYNTTLPVQACAKEIHNDWSACSAGEVASFFARSIISMYVFVWSFLRLFIPDAWRMKRTFNPICNGSLAWFTFSNTTIECRNYSLQLNHEPFFSNNSTLVSNEMYIVFSAKKKFFGEGGKIILQNSKKI